MDELKKIIDLNPLSDLEIKDSNYDLIDLWMIKDSEDRIFGPYVTHQLKEYIEKHESLFTQTTIYNLEEEKWYKTFSIAHFQRRKPQLVSTNANVENDEYFILINGQKSGPFTEPEVQKLLNNGQITTTSELSVDKGQSWMKLYQHSAFDRRAKKSNQELPFQPAAEVLEKMAKTKEEILTAKEKNEAIVQLAMIGHKKNTNEQHSETSENTAINSKKEHNSNKNQVWKMIAIASITICIISFSAFKLISGFHGSNSPQRTTEKVKSIDNSQRNINKKETRRPAQMGHQQRKLVRPKKITRKTPHSYNNNRRNAPKRYRPQRPMRNMPVSNASIRKQDIEEIDINNPEVQEELTRELAGDGDLEELSEDERFEDEQSDYDEDSEYGPDELEVHTSEDY